MGARRRRVFTNEERAEIVAMYATGGLNTIAKKFRCGQDLIKAVLREEDVEIRPSTVSDKSCDGYGGRGTRQGWRQAARAHYMELGLTAVAELYA